MRLKNSPDKIDSLLEKFEKRGLDGVSLLTKGMHGIENSGEVIDERMAGLEKLALDVGRIISEYPDALAVFTETISQKLPVIQNFLTALRSEIPAVRAVNEKPRLLARSANKLMTVGGILEGFTDMRGLHIRHVEPFARNSVDTVFAALTQKVQTDGLVWSGDLDRTTRAIRVEDRRNHNLDSIKDVSIHQILGARAINAYLADQPLTEKELANYPELEDLTV
jgi:hypothetical protein